MQTTPTTQELAQIKARRHTVLPLVDDQYQNNDDKFCAFEGDKCPCDVARFTAYLENLEKVAEAAREVWRLYDGPANYPLIAELGAALAALGGSE